MSTYATSRLRRDLDTAMTLCTIATGITRGERVGATDGDWPMICREAAREVRATAGNDSRLWRLASYLEFAAQDVEAALRMARAEAAALVGAA